MKYLKLYENHSGISLLEFINRAYVGQKYELIAQLNVNSMNIKNLNGAEKLINLKSLNCQNNNIKSLKGIEKCIKLRHLVCYQNELESLKGIENLINIEQITCSSNKLKNLHGIENLDKLIAINCSWNHLTNLDDIKNLSNLLRLMAIHNDWKYPLPIEYVNRFGYDNLYSYKSDNDKFTKYELQKEFLALYPERVNDLKPFEIHEKIREEFADIIEGSEFGFFGLI